VPSRIGHADAAPLDGRAEGSAKSDFGGLIRSFGTCCHTLHADVAAHVQGLLPAGRLGLTGGSQTHWIAMRGFQLVLTIIRPSCSPDATTLRRQLVSRRTPSGDAGIALISAVLANGLKRVGGDALRDQKLRANV